MALWIPAQKLIEKPLAPNILSTLTISPPIKKTVLHTALLSGEAVLVKSWTPRRGRLKGFSKRDSFPQTIARSSWQLQDKPGTSRTGSQCRVTSTSLQSNQANCKIHRRGYLASPWFFQGFFIPSILRLVGRKRCICWYREGLKASVEAFALQNGGQLFCRLNGRSSMSVDALHQGFELHNAGKKKPGHDVKTAKIWTCTNYTHDGPTCLDRTTRTMTEFRNVDAWSQSCVNRLRNIPKKQTKKLLHSFHEATKMTQHDNTMWMCAARSFYSRKKKSQHDSMKAPHHKKENQKQISEKITCVVLLTVLFCWIHSKYCFRLW